MKCFTVCSGIFVCLDKSLHSIQGWARTPVFSIIWDRVDKPARLTIRVLWFLFLIVKSEVKKANRKTVTLSIVNCPSQCCPMLPRCCQCGAPWRPVPKPIINPKMYSGFESWLPKLTFPGLFCAGPEDSDDKWTFWNSYSSNSRLARNQTLKRPKAWKLSVCKKKFLKSAINDNKQQLYCTYISIF